MFCAGTRVLRDSRSIVLIIALAPRIQFRQTQLPGRVFDGVDEDLVDLLRAGGEGVAQGREIGHAGGAGEG